MSFPRVLIVALGRINKADTANNGLLLRNLFEGWPRESLAQIYSSGDNSDEGFFGHYYQLGPAERQFGSLFYRLKRRDQLQSSTEAEDSKHAVQNDGLVARSKSLIGKLLIKTGFYELIFRPKISQNMRTWVTKFNPDIIFAQGYNLTFTWLPMMLADHFCLPIAYYPTDDWPNDLYRNSQNRPRFITKWVRSFVTTSSCQLVKSSAVRIAFNPYMQETFAERYGLDFSLLMHGDDFNRFALVEPERLTPTGVFSIVCTGVFDYHRLPLLHDLEKACEKLTNQGVNVHATVLPVNFPLPDTVAFHHLHFAPCPSHAGLASMLCGADILFLPERFDESAKDIRLCISSKAHLFMFSGRPIVVYSDPVTGIARYARQEGWAAVVERRDAELLAATFEGLINSQEARERISSRALIVARRNHDLKAIQSKFLGIMKAATQQGGE